MRDRKAPAQLLVAAFILAAVFGALLGWSMFFPCVRSLIFPGGIMVLQKGQWMVEMGEQPLLLRKNRLFVKDANYFAKNTCKTAKAVVL